MNSRAKLMSLVVLSFGAALAGCTTGSQSGLGVSGASVPYFVVNRTVSIDREYMDRYTCGDDNVLRCTCESLRWGKCLCHCE